MQTNHLKRLAQRTLCWLELIERCNNEIILTQQKQTMYRRANWDQPIKLMHNDTYYKERLIRYDILRTWLVQRYMNSSVKLNATGLEKINQFLNEPLLQPC